MNEPTNGSQKNGNTDSSLQNHDPSLEQAPQAILELVAACIRFIETKYKAQLDFTGDTLSFVDQYIRDVREDVKARPESAPLLASATGAYLGEVMRRTFGGTWWAEGQYEAFRLQMSSVYLSFNPIGMMTEALATHEVEGSGAHFEVEEEDREAIKEKLSTIDVLEEEYFLPTTRFDTLHLMVDTLRARMEARGHGDVTFGNDDYR